VDRRAHEQPPVAAAADGQVLRTGVAVGDQPLACRNEIVEHVLLVLEHARPVPILAELAAAAQCGERKDAALLDPRDGARVETRHLGRVEAAVACQQGGMAAVQRDAIAMHDVHRSARAIARRVPDLLHGDARRVERDVRRVVHVARAVRRIHAIRES